MDLSSISSSLSSFARGLSATFSLRQSTIEKIQHIVLLYLSMGVGKSEGAFFREYPLSNTTGTGLMGASNIPSVGTGFVGTNGEHFMWGTLDEDFIPEWASEFYLANTTGTAIDVSEDGSSLFACGNAHDSLYFYHWNGTTDEQRAYRIEGYDATCTSLVSSGQELFFAGTNNEINGGVVGSLDLSVPTLNWLVELGESRFAKKVAFSQIHVNAQNVTGVGSGIDSSGFYHDCSVFQVARDSGNLHWFRRFGGSRDDEKCTTIMAGSTGADFTVTGTRNNGAIAFLGTMNADGYFVGDILAMSASDYLYPKKTLSTSADIVVVALADADLNGIPDRTIIIQQLANNTLLGSTLPGEGGAVFEWQNKLIVMGTMDSPRRMYAAGLDSQGLVPGFAGSNPTSISSSTLVLRKQILVGVHRQLTKAVQETWATHSSLNLSWTDAAGRPPQWTTGSTGTSGTTGTIRTTTAQTTAITTGLAPNRIPTVSASYQSEPPPFVWIIVGGVAVLLASLITSILVSIRPRILENGERRPRYWLEDGIELLSEARVAPSNEEERV